MFYTHLTSVAVLLLCCDVICMPSIGGGQEEESTVDFVFQLVTYILTPFTGSISVITGPIYMRQKLAQS